MHGMRKNLPLLQWTLVLGLGLAVGGCDTVSGAADSVGNAVSSVGDAVGNVASDLNPFSDSTPSQTADNDAPPASSPDAAAGTSPDLANCRRGPPPPRRPSSKPPPSRWLPTAPRPAIAPTRFGQGPKPPQPRLRPPMCRLRRNWP